MAEDTVVVAGVQRAAFRLLLATGEPGSLQRIGEAAGIREGVVLEVVEALEARGRALRDDRGRVIVVAGLSVPSTRHRIEMNGAVRWTKCAYDALGVLGALAGDGTLVTTSPLDESRIEIRFANGSPAPSDAALFYADGYDACASVFDEWCPLVNLFPSRRDAERWAGYRGVTGRTLGIAEATESATREWLPLVPRGGPRSP